MTDREREEAVEMTSVEANPAPTDLGNQTQVSHISTSQYEGGFNEEDLQLPFTAKQRIKALLNKKWPPLTKEVARETTEFNRTLERVLTPPNERGSE